jgi:hypothetical protein
MSKRDVDKLLSVTSSVTVDSKSAYEAQEEGSSTFDHDCSDGLHLFLLDEFLKHHFSSFILETI